VPIERRRAKFHAHPPWPWRRIGERPRRSAVGAAELAQYDGVHPNAPSRVDAWRVTPVRAVPATWRRSSTHAPTVLDRLSSTCQMSVPVTSKARPVAVHPGESRTRCGCRPFAIPVRPSPGGVSQWVTDWQEHQIREPGPGRGEERARSHVVGDRGGQRRVLPVNGFGDHLQCDRQVTLVPGGEVSGRVGHEIRGREVIGEPPSSTPQPRPVITLATSQVGIRPSKGVL